MALIGSKSKKKAERKSKDIERLDSWWDENESVLDDFDSAPIWKPKRYARTDYLDSMWGGRSFRANDQISDTDLVTAHTMVSSFVNALSRGEKYAVLFDAATNTAGTDMKAKRTYITTAPILDRSISATEAGRILTALAVHEICHPRYGKGTFEATLAIWKGMGSAPKVSNLLDDIRIESRFVRDYPGYSGLFDPMLQYVGKASMKDGNNGKPFDPSKMNALEIGIAATRYPFTVEWKGWEDERRWWIEWSERWSSEDSPRRHVIGVREALVHIAAFDLRKAGTGSGRKKGPRQTTEKGSSEGIGDGSAVVEEGGGAGGGNLDKDEYDEKAGSLSDDELNSPKSSRLPEHTGADAVNEAAGSNGVLGYDMQTNNGEADRRVKDAKFYETLDSGQRVEVLRNLDGVANGVLAQSFRRSDAATSYIRDALMRSRTGHNAESRHRKRGKLDRRSYHKTSHGDYRLFTKRLSESVDKFLIWVMVDVSSSMRGTPVMEAAQVATAFAEASAHVPSVRMAVWAWSNKFRDSNASSNGVNAGVAQAWRTGEPPTRVKRLIGLRMGGTPDSASLDWAGAAIRREARSNERPVILMCSDGAGNHDMNRIVEKVRESGVEVYGVSFGLSDEQLRSRYGDQYVSWRGSIVETARPLADLVAKMVRRRGAA